MYSLTLTLSEIAALQFVAARGYSETVWLAVSDALTDEQWSDVHDRTAHEITVAIPEHAAWDIAEERDGNGGHHFGPVSEALTFKLYALVGSIV